MNGEYKEVVNGFVHYYCVHHKTENSIKIDGLTEKSLLERIKELTPLLSVILLISLIAGIHQISGTNLMLYMMDWMGVFLLTFGMLKLIDLKGFAEGFISYDIIAKKFTHYGYAFPFIEIGLGVLYLLGYMFMWQNALVLMISLLGMYSAYKVITNKQEIRCVCMGTLFHIPMTWATFAENFLMGIMIIFMLSI